MNDEEVRCQECGKRRATWHVTNLEGGKAVQQHLCEECYVRQEGTPRADEAVAQLIAAVVPELKEMAMRSCPHCGLSYLEFRQSMRLGCPNDYRAFDRPLGQLLERIHGAVQHTGKAPSTAGREEAVKSRVRSLRKRQEEAVAQENYELAADLRDQIGELEEHGPDAPEG